MGKIVFESLLPVLLIIITGLGLRKSRIVSEEHWLGIELLSYWLLFPVLVVVSLIHMDLSKINLGALTNGYLLAVIAQLIIVWLLKKPLQRHLNVSSRSFSSIFQTSTRWNAFIALAISYNFAGNDGLAIVSLIMAITLPILNVVNVVVLTLCCSETKPTLASTAINTLKVPLIWGALLGLSLNLADISVYGPLMASLDIIGRAGLGIGLLTVGAGLHTHALLNARMTMLFSIVAKLIVFPLLVFTSCMIFDVNGLTLQMAMLSASVSTAMNGYILARQMGGDADLYAASASLQVVISMVTIPLVLWLVSGFL